MRELTLALDGSTYAASVALLRDGEIVAESRLSERTDGKGGGRGELLVPLISQCLEGHGSSPREITRVICGAGPGSFTSLRIAASVGKGIAFAAKVEMYAVSSLLLTVAGLAEKLSEGSYLSVLPAMRVEWFALEVSVRDSKVEMIDRAQIIAEGEIPEVAKRIRAKVIGPGREIDALPHARGSARLIDAILRSGPIDLSSWEPDYGRPAEAQVKWEAVHGRPLRA